MKRGAGGGGGNSETDVRNWVEWDNDATKHGRLVGDVAAHLNGRDVRLKDKSAM